MRIIYICVCLLTLFAVEMRASGPVGVKTREYLEKIGMGHAQGTADLSALLSSMPTEVRFGLAAAAYADACAAPGSVRGEHLTNLVEIILKDRGVGVWLLGRLVLPPWGPDDFDGNAVDVLTAASQLYSDVPEYVKVAGVLSLPIPSPSKNNVDPGVAELLSLTEAPHDVAALNFFESIEWATLLARARTGDEQALAAVLERVMSLPTDSLAKKPRILEDLGYVHRKEAVDLLVSFLFTAGEDHVDRDHITLHISRLAPRGLSLCVEGFPVDYWSALRGSDEIVAISRDFVKQSGDQLRIKRYSRVITHARVESNDAARTVASAARKDNPRPAERSSGFLSELLLFMCLSTIGFALWLVYKYIRRSRNRSG